MNDTNTRTAIYFHYSNTQSAEQSLTPNKQAIKGDENVAVAYICTSLRLVMKCVIDCIYPRQYTRPLCMYWSICVVAFVSGKAVRVW